MIASIPTLRTYHCKVFHNPQLLGGETTTVKASTSKSEVGPPPDYEELNQPSVSGTMASFPSTSKAGTASPRRSTASLSESIASSTTSSKNSNLSRKSSEKSHDCQMTKL